jgi:hypothetical protein
MKIGIVTFHYNNNFGAVLQCYALQRFVRELGHEVEIINYVPLDGGVRPFWRGWNIKSGNFLENAQQRIRQLRHQRSASAVFRSFREKFFSMSTHCDSLAGFRNVAKKCDAVICGSDQVWVFERSSPYFLDLGATFKGLRISYAACCGHDHQRSEKFEEIRGLLRDFDFISVRNDFSQTIISNLVDKSVHIVADPTLLIEFDEMMEPRDLPFENYILIYSLSDSLESEQSKILSEIRKKVGDLPVVAVVSNSCPKKSPCAGGHIYDATPMQWVWLIAHASFVYTDSFHGALFSLKYNRLFLVDYKEKWRSLRLLDISRRYRLSSHVSCSVEESIEKIRCMDDNFFSEKDLIEKHVLSSKKWLISSLGSKE